VSDGLISFGQMRLQNVWQAAIATNAGGGQFIKSPFFSNCGMSVWLAQWVSSLEYNIDSAIATPKAPRSKKLSISGSQLIYLFWSCIHIREMTRFFLMATQEHHKLNYNVSLAFIEFGDCFCDACIG
jgi:hypothetical protein